MKRCMFIKNVCVLLVPEDNNILFSWCTTEQELNGILAEPDRERAGDIGEVKMVSRDVGVRMDYIFVKERDYFRRIIFSSILWIEASGSYCCLHLYNEPKMMLSFNLSEFSVYLPESYFVRVHRSYIVNINHVDSFIGNLLCVGRDRIPISKQHRASVIARLNVLGNTKI